MRCRRIRSVLSSSRRSHGSASAFHGHRWAIRMATWRDNSSRRPSSYFFRRSCSHGWRSGSGTERPQRRLRRGDQDRSGATRQTRVGLSDADPGPRAGRVASGRGGGAARPVAPSRRGARAAQSAGEMSGREPAAPVAGLGAAARANNAVARRSLLSRGRIADGDPIRPTPPPGGVGFARTHGVVLRLVSGRGELQGRSRACGESGVGPDGPRRGVRGGCARGTRSDEHPDCTATPCCGMARSAVPVAAILDVWSV